MLLLLGILLWYANMLASEGHGENKNCDAFNSTIRLTGSNISVVRNHLKNLLACDTVDNDQVLFNADGFKMTALMLAAKEGQLDIVVGLLDRGADVNWMDKYQLSPLMLAAKNGHEEVVTALLNQGSDV